MIDQVISALASWIVEVISAAGYFGVVLLMAIESACIPLPSELIMPFAGYLVFTGKMKLVDSTGQIERFRKKFGQNYRKGEKPEAEKKA